MRTRVALLLLVISAPWVRSADEPLPKAEVIIDRFVEATGGKAAYQKCRTEVTTGAMEFVGKGIKGSVRSYKAEPNKTYSVTELEGVGTIEEGSDGKVAWSRSAIQGPRIKSGEEKTTSLRLATFNPDLRLREIYKTIECVGVETIDGQVCYKVVMTPQEGSPDTRYYDKKTNLLVRTSIILKSPMGEVPVESYLSDYRKEGDILVAHKLKQKALGQEFLILIDKVTWNRDLPKDRFDLPDDVKALTAQ
jgi:zinc protease